MLSSPDAGGEGAVLWEGMLASWSPSAGQEPLEQKQRPAGSEGGSPLRVTSQVLGFSMDSQSPAASSGGGTGVNGHPGFGKATL